MRITLLIDAAMAFVFCLSAGTTQAADHVQPTDTKENVRQRLQSRFLESLYTRTYYSLLDRMEPDGFLKESEMGVYPGMFPRTCGGMVSLLLETGELDAAERMLNCVLLATTSNDMERVPHVMERRVGPSGAVEYPIFCDQHQLDGQANVLMAWARLALRRGGTTFEDRTYPLVVKLMDRTVDRPLFMFGDWPTEPELIRNLCLEHSREGRYWDAFDILTQCHVGAALEEMAKVAERRGDVQHVKRWRERMAILKGGVARNLVRQVDGKTTMGYS